MGCGSKFTESAFPGQLVHEHMPKQLGLTGQAEDDVSLVWQAIAMLVLFCCYSFTEHAHNEPIVLDI